MRQPGKLRNISAILIADDHEEMLWGLAGILGQEKGLKVVDVARNGEELIAKADILSPDLCLVDYEMPGINGLVASEMLLKKNKDMKIIILTMHNENSLLKRIKALGVKGFLLKGCENSELIFAINRVLDGETYF